MGTACKKRVQNSNKNYQRSTKSKAKKNDYYQKKKQIDGKL